MPATKARIKNSLADIEAELSQLQERHEQATRGAAEARRRADELAARRGDLATPAYFNEAPAVEELAALDVEASTLARSVSLALDAAASLEGAITETKERLSRERERASSERLAELRAERQRVQDEALEAAGALLEVLARDRDVHARMVREAQGVSTRLLENTSQDHDGAALHRALAERLRAYARAWV